MAIKNALSAIWTVRSSFAASTGALAALPVVPGERVGPTARTLGDGVTTAGGVGTGAGTLFGFPDLCVAAGVGVELE